MEINAHSNPFPQMSCDSPLSRTESLSDPPSDPFQALPLPRTPAPRSIPAPLALTDSTLLSPEIKAVAEAQRAAASQYPDSLARMVGTLSAKIFENQYVQEELISRLPACPAPRQPYGPGQGLDTSSRIREMETALRGRREFTRIVQLEARLRTAKRLD